MTLEGLRDFGRVAFIVGVVPGICGIGYVAGWAHERWRPSPHGAELVCEHGVVVDDAEHRAGAMVARCAPAGGR